MTGGNQPRFLRGRHARGARTGLQPPDAGDPRQSWPERRSPGARGRNAVMGSTRSQWDGGLRAEREGVTERHVQECEKSVLDLES